MYDNEFFVVDMASCSSTGEIINSLSLALETLNHSGKKIVLKLNDSYFNSYTDGDVIAKARVLSAKQLGNLQKNIRFENNHKEILTLLNTTVQQILLGNDDVKKVLESAAKDWKRLEQ